MNDAPIAVLGSGIAGLTAGLTLVAAGVPCIMFEASQRVGGCCATIKEDGAVFEPAASVILGTRMLANVWEELGVSFHHLLAPVQPAVRMMWPDDQFDFFGPTDALAESIGKQTPEDVPKLFRLVERCSEVAERLYAGLWNFKMGRGLERLSLCSMSPWALQSYRTLVRRTFRNPRLRQAFEAFSDFYAGVSAKDAPAVVGIIPALTLTQGCYRVKGGIQRLPELLASEFQQRGGEIRCREPIRKIVIRDGLVREVETPSRVVPVSGVTAACDIHSTLACMPGNQLRMARLRIQRLRPSVACASIFGLEEGNLKLPTMTWILPNKGFDKTSERGWHMKRLAAVSRGPEGVEPMGVRVGGALVGKPVDGWDSATNAITENLLRMLDDVSLPIHIRQRRFWGPPDYETQLGLPGGAAFGFALSRWQLAPSLYGPTTPISNFTVAGQSCFPGFGIPMAALSGRLAALALLEARR